MHNVHIIILLTLSLVEHADVLSMQHSSISNLESDSSSTPKVDKPTGADQEGESESNLSSSYRMHIHARK